MRHALTLLLKFFYEFRFLLGSDFRKHILRFNARLFCDTGRSERVVASDQVCFKPLPGELPNHFRRTGLDHIFYGEQAKQFRSLRQPDNGRALSRPFIDKILTL